ncbi:MAG: hypothetical protein K0R54_529 [Clostridiaceae bacterium]|jgi:hypothetical protein|nr:hypothetical protein [Clostridiaceae bacterium]
MNKGYTKYELLENLELMGYDFAGFEDNDEEIENKERNIAEMREEDIDWASLYEMAINEDFKFCERTGMWYNTNDDDYCDEEDTV